MTDAWRPPPKESATLGTRKIWAAMGGLTVVGLGAVTWWLIAISQIEFPCADEVQDFNTTEGSGPNRPESKALETCVDRECTDEFLNEAMGPVWWPWLVLLTLAAVAWVLYVRHAKKSPMNSANLVLLLFPVVATLVPAVLFVVGFLWVALGCDPNAFL